MSEETNKDRIYKFVPVCELQTDQRDMLISKLRQSELRSGEKLVGSEQYRWMIYLLEGSLDIYEHGSLSGTISATSNRALRPLFSEQSHHVVAKSTSNCTLVYFDRQYFNTLSDQSILEAEELETIEVNETEGHLFQSIMQAFNQGLLEMPALPEVALKVKDAVNNPDVDVQLISKILEADPAIVGRLIQVANSPVHRAMGPVDTIRAAVIRLGLAGTRDLVICFAIKQLFNSTSPLLLKRMKQLYEDSTEIAAIAYAIAKNATKLEPDSMLLAGLVHDIGVIPILAYIDKTGLVVEEMNQVEEIINDLRAIVGSMVISSWGLTSELQAVVENSEDCKQHRTDKIEMCDVILVSKIYYRLKHHQVKGLPKLSDVPAFKKIFPEDQGLLLIQKILEQAADEVEEVKSLLSS